MKPLTKKQERSLSIHEAGHAVIGRVLGMSCGKVTIVPSPSEGTAGHAITHDRWVTYEAWEKRGKSRDVASVVRGRIMTLMAATEAETVCIGRRAVGGADDRYWIAIMKEEIAIPDDDWERYERRLRAKTRTRVRRHRHKIEHLAKALIERRTISGRDVDRLLRQVTSADERRRLRRIHKAPLRTEFRDAREAMQSAPCTVVTYAPLPDADAVRRAATRARIRRHHTSRGRSPGVAQEGH